MNAIKVLEKVKNIEEEFSTEKLSSLIELKTILEMLPYEGVYEVSEIIERLAYCLTLNEDGTFPEEKLKAITLFRNAMDCIEITIVVDEPSLNYSGEEFDLFNPEGVLAYSWNVEYPFMSHLGYVKFEEVLIKDPARHITVRVPR